MVSVYTALPWSLVLLRVALAPAMVLLARSSIAGGWLSLLLLIALLSDIYDGVLARRWRCDTPRIRLADSLADTVFYIGVLAALALRHLDLLWRNRFLLGILLLLEAVRYLVDLRKFGRAASYHSYLAKLWGLIMAVAIMAVLAQRGGDSLLALSLCLGIASNMEGLAFSFLLPSWQHDIKTIRHALRKRRELLHANPAAHQLQP